MDSTDPIKRRSEAMRYTMRIRNIEKHLRIADATEGSERELHLAKALKLAEKYGIPTGRVLS